MTPIDTEEATEALSRIMNLLDQIEANDAIVPITLRLPRAWIQFAAALNVMEGQVICGLLPDPRQIESLDEKCLRRLARPILYYNIDLMMQMNAGDLREYRHYLLKDLVQIDEDDLIF